MKVVSVELGKGKVRSGNWEILFINSPLEFHYGRVKGDDTI